MCVLLSESVHVLLQWNSLYCKYLQESCFEQKTEFHSPGKKELGELKQGSRDLPGMFRLLPVHQCAGMVTRE